GRVHDSLLSFLLSNMHWHYSLLFGSNCAPMRSPVIRTSNGCHRTAANSMRPMTKEFVSRAFVFVVVMIDLCLIHRCRSEFGQNHTKRLQGRRRHVSVCFHPGRQ